MHTSTVASSTDAGSSAKCASAVKQAVQRRAARHGGVAAISYYLAAVYRDEGATHLGSVALVQKAAALGWRYHESKLLPPYLNISCVVLWHHWEPSFQRCGCHPDGLEVLRLRASSDLVAFNRYGTWLPAAQPRCTQHPSFVPDGELAEVLRIGGTATAREGGMAGCWFMRVAGSGVFLSVGRSLRARTRLDLLAGLQLDTLNSSMLRARSRTRRFVPWTWEDVKFEMLNTTLSRLEGRLDLCEHARRLGYDTIQLSDDMHCPAKNGETTSGRPCYAEMISCHDACIALPVRRARPTACVPGLPMHTGLHGQLECMCNASQAMINCDLTSPQLPSVLVDQAMGQRLAADLASRRPVCEACAATLQDPAGRRVMSTR